MSISNLLTYSVASQELYFGLHAYIMPYTALYFSFSFSFFSSTTTERIRILSIIQKSAQVRHVPWSTRPVTCISAKANVLFVFSVMNIQTEGGNKLTKSVSLEVEWRINSGPKFSGDPNANRAAAFVGDRYLHHGGHTIVSSVCCAPNWLSDAIFRGVGGGGPEWVRVDHFLR